MVDSNFFVFKKERNIDEFSPKISRAIKHNNYFQYGILKEKHILYVVQPF